MGKSHNFVKTDQAVQCTAPLWYIFHLEIVDEFFGGAGHNLESRYEMTHAKSLAHLPVFSDTQ